MIKKLFTSDREFYKTLLALSVPIALQNIVNVAVSMADTVMLGRLGEVALSSAANGSQLSFILMIIGFGIAGGANVLISQYRGKGNNEMIKTVMYQSQKVTAVVGTIFAVVALVFPEFIMKIFTTEPEVIAGGVEYMKVLGWSYPFMVLANVALMTFRSLGQVKVAVGVYLTSLCVNVFFNWVFIFGNLGVPAMGIKGAAIATAIARLSEFVLAFIFVYKVDKKIELKLRELFKKTPKNLTMNFFENVMPVAFNELLWSGGASVIAVIIGRMGKEFVAANSINQVVMQLGCVAMFGLGNAASVMIGTAVGEGDREKVKEYAKTLMILGLIVGVLAGTLLFFIRVPIVSIYNIGETSRQYALGIMKVTSLLMIFQSVNIIGMIGILRGGGDGRFVLMLDLVFLWAIAIPFGFLAAFKFGWPVPVVYICLKSDEIIKSTFAVMRIARGKWIKDLTISA